MVIVKEMNYSRDPSSRRNLKTKGNVAGPFVHILAFLNPPPTWMDTAHSRGPLVLFPFILRVLLRIP